MGNRNHFRLKHAPGGYYKDEVISALQKAIRRSDERRAVYWATVLELEGTKITTQMWHRMLIIANEDIGPADSSVIVKIKTLYDCWKEGLGSERLCVIHAALILARAPKSRTCCNLAVFLYDKKARPKVAIPDYALDRHTQKGYEMQRKWEHFITDASLLIQPDQAQFAVADKDYKEKAEAVLRAGWKGYATSESTPEEEEKAESEEAKTEFEAISKGF